MLVGYFLFWWAIFVLVGCISILVGYFNLYSGGLILFCWAVLFS